MKQILEKIIRAKDDDELNKIITEKNGIMEKYAKGLLCYGEKDTLEQIIYKMIHYKEAE